MIEIKKSHDNDVEDARQKAMDRHIKYGRVAKMPIMPIITYKVGNPNHVSKYYKGCLLRHGKIIIRMKPKYIREAKMKLENRIWNQIWKIARTLPTWSFDYVGNITYGGDKTGHTFETGIITEYALKRHQPVKVRRVKNNCKNT